jgi:ABC-2 type transport system permease protein
MTFLQRTLGVHYKWLYISKYNFAIANAGMNANIIRCFPKILSSLMVIFVWSKANPTIAIFTYLIVGRLYKSFAEGFSDQVVSQDIISGNLTSQILLPSAYLPVRFFSYIGRRVLRNFLEFITFVITAMLAIHFFSTIQLTSFATILILILFVPISFYMNFVLGYGVGLFAFFLKDKREFSSVQEGWLATNAILYGLIIPLDQLPFRQIFEFLPTAYFVHHPMQIYLGRYDNTQILHTFAGGIVWCLVLLVVTRTIFKLGLKRNEAVGL